MNISDLCPHELAIVCFERAYLLKDNETVIEFWHIFDDIDWFLYAYCRWCDRRKPLPWTWFYSDGFQWQPENRTDATGTQTTALSPRRGGSYVIGNPL